MKRLTRVARIDGVDVYFHWSTFLTAGIILIGSLPERLEITFVAVGAYLSMLMIHEWGHVVAGRRRGSAAWCIELYPILGLTRLSAPRSYFDECVIAWGGVLAQLAVALPLIAWVALFGFTPSEQINVVLALLGGFSVLIAVMNLIPAPRLDGSKAWALIPMLISRAIRGDFRRRREPVRADRKKNNRKWVH